jgi:hypothetical protein
MSNGKRTTDSRPFQCRTTIAGFQLSVFCFQLVDSPVYFVGLAPRMGGNSSVRVSFSPVNQ